MPTETRFCIFLKLLLVKSEMKLQMGIKPSGLQQVAAEICEASAATVSALGSQNPSSGLILIGPFAHLPSPLGTEGLSITTELLVSASAQLRPRVRRAVNRAPY